jgi:hypothetical protein
LTNEKKSLKYFQYVKSVKYSNLYDYHSFMMRETTDGRFVTGTTNIPIIDHSIELTKVGEKVDNLGSDVIYFKTKKKKF